MSSLKRYRYAAGLSFKREENDAPILEAKGQDWIAEEMVRLARRYGVPVVERKGLAQTLNQLSENQTIPEKLFTAVAQLFAELDRRLKGKGRLS